MRTLGPALVPNTRVFDPLWRDGDLERGWVAEAQKKL